jgi:hypothetical protein
MTGNFRSQTETALILSYISLGTFSLALFFGSMLIDNHTFHDLLFHLSIAFFGATAVFFLIDRVLLRRNYDILATIERSVVNLERKTHFLRSISDDTPFDQIIARARELFIFGNTLSRLMVTYEQAILQFLDRGGSLRLLILDPHGQGCQFLAAHSGRNAKSAIEGMLSIYRTFSARIQNTRRGEVELRVIDWPASCGMHLIDPNTPGGYIRVTLYPPDISSPLANRPHFILRPESDQPWYDIFREQFERLWRSAQPLRCSSTIVQPDRSALPGPPLLPNLQGK